MTPLFFYDMAAQMKFVASPQRGRSGEQGVTASSLLDRRQTSVITEYINGGIR